MYLHCRAIMATKHKFMATIPFLLFAYTLPLLIGNVSFACAGNYLMTTLKIFDIGSWKTPVQWDIKTYLTVWWTSHTPQSIKERTASAAAKLKTEPKNDQALRYLSKCTPIHLQDKKYYLWFMVEYVFKLIVTFMLPQYLDRMRPEFDPTPWKLLDLSNTQDVFYYLASGFSLYCIVFMGYSLYCHVLGYYLDFPAYRCFRLPFFATSLQDFWANRWNLNTQSVLRRAVYDRVMDHLPFRTTINSYIGIVSTFLFSGLLHDWLMYAHLGHTSFEQTGFFVLHGVLILLEGMVVNTVYRLTGYHILKHTYPPLLTLYTITVILWTSPLMMNPYMKAKVLTKLLE